MTETRERLSDRQARFLLSQLGPAVIGRVSAAEKEDLVRRGLLAPDGELSEAGMREARRLRRDRLVAEVRWLREQRDDAHRLLLDALDRCPDEFDPGVERRLGDVQMTLLRWCEPAYGASVTALRHDFGGRARVRDLHWSLKKHGLLTGDHQRLRTTAQGSAVLLAREVRHRQQQIDALLKEHPGLR